jgi:hypothetical protein
MSTRGVFFAGLPLSLVACAFVACASDPNKQANDAHAADLQQQRVQQEERAADRREQRVAAAEVLRENTAADAGGGTEERADAVEADAKVVEARSSFRAKAAERLEKADARTLELKQLVDRAGAKATTSSRDRLRTVDTQRSMVTKELEQLPRVPNESWPQAKSSLDSQLDTLEGLVKKAADEVGKIKR